MKYEDILNILKSNPDISYDDAKKQASKAGISNNDFHKAWRKVNKDFHDKRIIEIINELNKRTGGLNKSAVKAEFKSKKYFDDEIDLAFALQNAKLKTGPFSGSKTMLLILVVGILILVGVKYLFGLTEGIVQAIVIIVVVAEIAYIAFIGAQKSKIFFKILASDFNGKELTKNELGEFVKKLNNNGASYLKRSNGRFHTIFQTEYDKRPTSFGDFTYTIGSGKNRQSYTYLFIIQKTHKQFPPVQCYKNSLHHTSFIHGKDIDLESTEFNKLYKINSTVKESDAFYVLNPRVMSALIEKDKIDELVLFETIGDEIMLGFKKMGTAGSALRFKPPIIQYNEYKNIKDHLIRCLDIATDLNDVLCREIVDDGQARSVAKL